jgi:3-oxoadipate CoA-transferase alpha subunit
MLNKQVKSLAEAVAGIEDGATILCGGFGSTGTPEQLFAALLDQGTRDLVVVSNNAGAGTSGLATLIGAGRVRKILCSFPRTSNAHIFAEVYKTGTLELELIPQGTLSERIRATGAGIGAFYSPVSVGTRLAEGKEVRMIGTREYVLEMPIQGDQIVALIKAHRADRWGNLVYRKSARNFNPVMATAGHPTIVEVDEIVELGQLDPEAVVTPGIFVDRVYCAKEAA